MVIIWYCDLEDHQITAWKLIDSLKAVVMSLIVTFMKFVTITVKFINPSMKTQTHISNFDLRKFQQTLFICFNFIKIDVLNTAPSILPTSLGLVQLFAHTP